jgi:hypothetical protein
MLKFILLPLTLFYCFHAQASFTINVEAGALWQNRNDVQIPPDTLGTRVELDRFGEGPFAYSRIEAFYRPLKNHGFRFLIAPFSVNVSGQPAQNIQFNGTTFAANTPTDFTYTFNSYRATWFYAFWGHGDDQLNLGFTAKIRQAETRFQQGALSSTYDNVGFVPLVYFEYQKALSPHWRLNFSMDGLAGGPGRAFDVALKIRRQMSESTHLGIGYRTLEGGADNDEVFTFSWFNYALVDFGITW